jgi:hypothetical protein
VGALGIDLAFGMVGISDGEHGNLQELEVT